MKRIIALLISLLLIIFSSVTASAEVDMDKLREDFITYCEELEGMKYEPELPWIGDIILENAFEENGVIFFVGHSWGWVLDSEITKQIGDWYFCYPVLVRPGGLGLCVQSDGKIYDLETAYNTGIITDLSPTLNFLGNRDGYTIYPNGDANGDSTVDIKDATTIQKNLAGLETMLIREDMRQVIIDTDKDGSITVRDATVIQKQIAGLE